MVSNPAETTGVATSTRRLHQRTEATARRSPPGQECDGHLAPVGGHLYQAKTMGESDRDLPAGIEAIPARPQTPEQFEVLPATARSKRLTGESPGTGMSWCLAIALHTTVWSWATGCAAGNLELARVPPQRLIVPDRYPVESILAGRPPL